MNAFRTTVLLCACLLGFTAQAATIWVAPDGIDSQSGTKEQPLASLHAALRQAREWRRLNDPQVAGGIDIVLRGGRYFLQEPVRLVAEDAGKPDAPTCIKAAAGESPILDGGCQLKGWKQVAGSVPGLPASANGQIWAAPVPQSGGWPLTFRQLWVGERKAVRARFPNNDDLPRITGWNKHTGILSLPAVIPATYTHTSLLELTLHQRWAIAHLRVAGLKQQGDSLHVTFKQPEARIQAEHPWPQPVMDDSVRSPFYLSNAIEFLDEPGEWFVDPIEQLVFYWPRPGEDLTKADVFVPVLETLLEVKGTPEQPVTNIRFEGLAFEHSTWLRPSQQGHVSLQAGMFLLDAYKLKPPGVPGNPNKGLENQAWIGRQPAAVTLKHVAGTVFAGCRFEHLGSAGYDLVEGSLNDSVTGCLFRDIAGNGLQVGTFSHPGVETHLPYNPSDERVLCRKMTITNNLITDVTNEDWGCVGLAAGYVRGITIAHNELSELSYTGISLGWGWTKAVNAMRDNRVHANRIHHYGKHMYDVAGIYTLSVQPNTYITENAVEAIYKPAYAHDPNHWFWLYTDEGSSYITVKDNWCPSEKFLANANGPGTVWTNNGPQVSEAIRLRAGIQPGANPYTGQQ
jgi:hypothetical protein